MKNILITGVSGYIAPYLCIEFIKEIEKGAGYKLNGLYNSHSIEIEQMNLIQCDLNETLKLKYIFHEIKPAVVYHLASVTPTRIGNKPEEYIYHFNRDITAEIAKLCAEYNSLMIYTSSDLVYSDGQNLKEDGTNLNPLSVYAKSKLSGENAVKEFASRYIILRTSLVYGFSISSYNSFFDIAYDILSKGNSIRAFTDQFRNTIYTEDAAKILIQLINVYCENDTINFCGDEYISRYDMCKLMAEVYNFPSELVIPSTCDEFKDYKLIKRIGLNNEKMKQLRLKTGSYRENLIKSFNYKPV